MSTCGWKIGSHDVRVEENQSGNRIDIEVKVPRGMPASSPANWTRARPRGSINCEFPLTVSSSGDEDAHAVRGKLNGGGPMLEIRTQDGRIDVMKD